MKGTTDKDQFLNDHQRFEEALEDALSILWFYEDDDYQCLAGDSIIDSLVDNFAYSFSDSRSILERALVVHNARLKSGYYVN